LKRASTTCRSFQAALIARPPEEHAAFPKLALESFGRETIACIAALIARCLTGASLARSSIIHMGTTLTYADGSQRVQAWIPCPSAGESLEEGEIQLEYSLQGGSATEMGICWSSPTSWVDLQVSRRRGVTITVQLHDEDDVRGLALVQVLLKGCYGQTFHTVGQPVEIHVVCFCPSDRSRVQSRVAALLPWASHYFFADNPLRKPYAVKEYSRVKQGVPHAKPPVTLRLTLSGVKQSEMMGSLALPSEVLDNIFGRFSAEELARVATTCATFPAARVRQSVLGYPYPHPHL
jgi:hypothetical protein